MRHYSTSRQVRIEDAFRYFSAFEKYPEYYPKHCVKLDILEKNENTIITKEMWNLPLGPELLHKTVKVKYTLFPYKEIQYEILDETNSGKKNSSTFEDRNGSIAMNLSMVPLDIVEFSYDRTSENFQNLQQYFARRDTRCLEGKSTGYEPGDQCPHCKNGGLFPTGKKDVTSDNQYEYAESTEMQCDKCARTVTMHGRGLHN